MEDAFLDALAVESAVGKAVDREDVGLGGGEPVLEAREVVGLEEFVGGACGEPEAEGEGGLAAELVAHGERVGFEHVFGFLPRLGGVDVGAVGEVAEMGFHAGFRNSTTDGRG